MIQKATIGPPYTLKSVMWIEIISFFLMSQTMAESRDQEILCIESHNQIFRIRTKVDEENIYILQRNQIWQRIRSHKKDRTDLERLHDRSTDDPCKLYRPPWPQEYSEKNLQFSWLLVG